MGSWRNSVWVSCGTRASGSAVLCNCSGPATKTNEVFVLKNCWLGGSAGGILKVFVWPKTDPTSRSIGSEHANVFIISSSQSEYVVSVGEFANLVKVKSAARGWSTLLGGGL